jgi:hypothetical protein
MKHPPQHSGSDARRECRRLRIGRLIAGWAAVVLACSAALADESLERRRSQLLDQMRGLAEQTEVRYVEGGQPELNRHPIFRYDDQPRRFIDATMWVWSDAGRPVAFQKVEAKYHVETDKPEWGYCFTSAAPGLLSVGWPNGNEFRSTEPGVEFRDLAGPAASKNSVVRRRQFRDHARRFSVRLVLDPRNNVTQELRLLSTPILEYIDERTRAPGAVFGFAANGVNPDVLLLLEACDEGMQAPWRYAPVRMTSSGVILRLDETTVFEVPWVNWNEAPFPTWTFFYTPRIPIVGEEAP